MTTILVLTVLGLIAAALLGVGWYASYAHGERWSAEQHVREAARAAAKVGA